MLRGVLFSFLFLIFFRGLAESVWHAGAQQAGASQVQGRGRAGHNLEGPGAG